MSKIYDKYIELKTSPNYQENTLYLFKSGLFFIFIDKDAQIVSNILNLKLSHLNETILKCGFPVQALKVNIDSLSISQTYDFLYHIQNKLIELKSDLK